MRGLMENAVSGGKRGVWWKTRGTTFFAKIRIFLTKMRSQNFVCLYWDEYQFSISAWNAFLDQKSKSNISWERKPFKSQRVVNWFFLRGGLFYFSQQLAFQSFSDEKSYFGKNKLAPRVLEPDPAFSTKPRVFHQTPRFPHPGTPYPGTPAPRFPPSLHLQSAKCVENHFCVC